MFYIGHPTTFTVKNAYLVEQARRMEAKADQELRRSRTYGPASRMRVDLEERADSYYRQSAAILQGILLHGYCEGEA